MGEQGCTVIRREVKLRWLLNREICESVRSLAVCLTSLKRMKIPILWLWIFVLDVDWMMDKTCWNCGSEILYRCLIRQMK